MQLLPEDCAIDLDKIKVNRIGKMTDGKVRPVKIALQSKEQAKQVLRVKPKIDSGWFKPDLTRIQRNKLKGIHNELNSRQEAGEKNFIIRYKFGEPYIDKMDNLRRSHPKITVK